MSDTADYNIIAAAQIVPIVPANNQTLSVTLANQPCKINIFTKHIQVPVHPPGSIITNPPIFEAIDPIFLDLYLNDVLVVGGVLCLNRVGIVRNPYFGFVGDLSFADTLGDEDPQVSGLGNRWLLCYWPNLL